MSSVVKNLAAVADAPLTGHTLSFLSQLLADRENQERLFVVAHRYTGDHWSTTVYDVQNHHLYRAMHPKSVRSWLQAIARERGNIKVLKDQECMRLQVYEDERVSRATWF